MVVLVQGGKREGMVARPNNPIDKVRELQRKLYTAAKRNREDQQHVRRGSGEVTIHRKRGSISLIVQEARMPREKTIGKPYAGNPHVRFERGPQETEPARHRA